MPSSPHTSLPPAQMGPNPARRTLIKGAVWTVPAVSLAAAAPAYASSACVVSGYELDWSADWSIGQGTASPKPTLAPESLTGKTVDVMTVSVKSVLHGDLEPHSADGSDGLGPLTNLAVVGKTTGRGTSRDPYVYSYPGGLGEQALVLLQKLKTSSPRLKSTTAAGDVTKDRQTVTFTFDREVSDITFTIIDIDAYKYSTSYNYRDGVYLSVPAVTIPLGPGSNTDSRITGAGTENDPWRTSKLPTTDTGRESQSAVSNVMKYGNVTVRVPGPVRSFDLSFFNRETEVIDSTGRGGQAIFLSNLSFTASTCKPSS